MKFWRFKLPKRLNNVFFTADLAYYFVFKKAVKMMTTTLVTDPEIAQKIELKPIIEIDKKLGLDVEEIEMYGKYKAKLPLNRIDKKR